MSNSPIKDLLDKALAKGLVTKAEAESALDTCRDLVEVIEWFTAYVTASGSGDPEKILREWGFFE